MMWNQRTREVEIMDDVSLRPEILEQNLREITLFNRLLGGDRVTLEGIKKLLRVHKGGAIHITDVGCGDGEMLRRIQRWADKKNVKVTLHGIDFNPNAIQLAREMSQNIGDIQYTQADILTINAADFKTDIVLCTLTLHHFEDGLLAEIMQKFIDAARLGVVINDLQRSKWAYVLFHIVSILFSLSKTSKNDGKISIRRGFTKAELMNLSENLIFKTQTIRHKWAFRLQWIIFAS